MTITRARPSHEDAAFRAGQAGHTSAPLAVSIVSPGHTAAPCHSSATLPLCKSGRTSGGHWARQFIETLDLPHSASREWGVTPHQRVPSTQTRGSGSSFRPGQLRFLPRPQQRRHPAPAAGAARAHDSPHASSPRDLQRQGEKPGSRSAVNTGGRQNKGRARQPPLPGTRGSTLGRATRMAAGTARDPPPALQGDARRKAVLPLCPYVPLPPLPSGTRPCSRRSRSSRTDPRHRHRPRSAAPLAGRRPHCACASASAPAAAGPAPRPPTWRGFHSDSGRSRAGAAVVVSNLPKPVPETGMGDAFRGCAFRAAGLAFASGHPRGPSLGGPPLLSKEGRRICFLFLETA